MYNGKRVAKRGKKAMLKNKNLLTVVALCLIATLAIGGTVAYLMTNTKAVVNTFVPATTGTEITEEFDKKTKGNVQVTNSSDFAAFVRATYTVYWAKEDGSVYGGAAPEYNITIKTDKWEMVNDVYYYTGGAVAANTKIADAFIVSCEPTGTAPEGCHLVVDVMAEVVQADPIDAVQDVWGMTYSGGTWSTYTAATN